MSSSALRGSLARCLRGGRACASTATRPSGTSSWSSPRCSRRCASASRCSCATRRWASTTSSARTSSTSSILLSKSRCAHNLTSGIG
ncbi:Protein of unknown function [Gryllus bimaculatus]|nr:Protein of unknown function [Gryllus bimaculatus]